MIFNLISKAKDLFINRDKTGVAADNVEDAISVLNSNLNSRVFLNTSSDETVPANLELTKYQRLVTVMTNVSNYIDVAELSSYTLPSSYRPMHSISADCIYRDANKAYYKGRVNIYYNGSIQVFKLVDGSNSATSVTDGSIGINVSWVTSS